MKSNVSEWRVKWATFIVKWVAELHRLRVPFTQRVVLPLNVRGLEKSLIEIHGVFGRHQIHFWLRDGTALGVLRDGGIISHDDDVDIGVWPEDLPALEQALSELEDLGFIVYKHTRWIIGLLRRWETIEIVISNSWEQDDEYNNFLDTFFHKLKPVQYLNLNFNVPEHSDAYLEFCYGPDWRTPRPFSWWASSCWLPGEERASYKRNFVAAHPETAQHQRSNPE